MKDDPGILRRGGVPAVLLKNLTERFITPSPSQYVHQWLWDSCFHAVVLSAFDPDWGWRELASLFDEQWDDGMVAHIRFGPRTGRRYRPDAEDWGTGRPTSGITQPPLCAVAAWQLFVRSGNGEMLERVYGPIARFHAWLKDVRDPDGLGLLPVVHPWESGNDNSPVYDSVRDDSPEVRTEPPARVDTRLVAEGQRPTSEDYLFYWGLIDRFQGWQWDQRRIARESPCRVADLTFNCIWARANADLARIAARLGHADQARRWAGLAEETGKALRKLCWDQERGFFFPLDMNSGQRIPIAASSGFLPLFCGAATEEMAGALVEHLVDGRRFRGEHGIASLAFDEPAFDEQRYWRGPAWINVQWMLQDGLDAYGFRDEAYAVRTMSRKLVERQGYREYYNPHTGEGLGACDFAWSSLADLMAQPNSV